MRAKEQKQQGLVAIIVTVVLMLVISLIITSFARLARQDEAQTLDRQLNVQALYAAETGVNDAVRFLESNSVSTQKTNCGYGGEYATMDDPGQYPPVLDASIPVAYTCILIDPNPETLSYDDIDAYKAVAAPLRASSALNTVQITWVDKDGNAAPCGSAATGANNLPAFGSGGWSACDTPMLRIDLIPESATGSFSAMQNGVFTTFVYPTNANSSPNYSSGIFNGTTYQQGLFSDANCSGAECVFSISGLTQTSYYIRIIPFYGAAKNISLSAGGLELAGAQAVIDSTGKARDVIKRIQVNAPLDGSGTAAVFGVHSGTDICKQFSFIPDNLFDSSGSCTDDF